MWLSGFVKCDCEDVYSNYHSILFDNIAFFAHHMLQAAGQSYREMETLLLLLLLYLKKMIMTDSCRSMQKMPTWLLRSSGFAPFGEHMNRLSGLTGATRWLLGHRVSRINWGSFGVASWVSWSHSRCCCCFARSGPRALKFSVSSLQVDTEALFRKMEFAIVV